MSSFLSAIEKWDPIGLGELPPPPTVAKVRDDSEALRAAVKGFVEAVQGLPSERAEDSRGLAACLNECLQEWRDESDAAQRELESLRTTVAKLQDERRQLIQAQHDNPSTPPAHSQSADKADEEAALRAAREAGFQSGRSEGRAEGFEEGRRVGQGEGRAEAAAEAAKAAEAARVREERLRKELRAAQVACDDACDSSQRMPRHFSACAHSSTKENCSVQSKPVNTVKTGVVWQVAEHAELYERAKRASEISSEIQTRVVIAALSATISELDQVSGAPRGEVVVEEVMRAVQAGRD